jgi:hypothetical protein
MNISAIFEVSKRAERMVGNSMRLKPAKAWVLSSLWLGSIERRAGPV